MSPSFVQPRNISIPPLFKIMVQSNFLSTQEVTSHKSFPAHNVKRGKCVHAFLPIFDCFYHQTDIVKLNLSALLHS